MSTLTRRINTYFAVLILTIFGSGASLIIMHVANANLDSLTQTYGSSSEALTNGKPNL